MKNIAIIPARSGSKGLPNKNIKTLCQKPLIAYSIEAAIESGMFDTIHVSTDSEVYAQIAREHGADVPFLRSAEMSTDKADSWDAVEEVLRNYEKLGKKFDTLTLLQPTSPLRGESDIKNAFELFEEKSANAIISVCEADHPPMWFHVLEEDGGMSDFANKGDEGKQRQDFAAYYRINGAVYLLDVNYFMENHRNIFRDRVFAYIMDKRASVDIDDQVDFDIAEAIMKIRQND